MKVVSPFGPKIAKLKISNNLINKLTSEAVRAGEHERLTIKKTARK